MKLQQQIASGMPLTKAMKSQLENWLKTANTID
jgi:hypothetical protein